MLRLPLPSDPASGSEEPLARRERSLTQRAKGGAAVQSYTAHAKRNIGTLALDGGEGFYKFFQTAKLIAF